MTFDLTAAAGILKEWYTDDRIENMVYLKNPFLAMVDKMEEFYGTNLPIPVEYANPQGRSATFATAQARGLATSTKAPRFALKRASDYSLADIDNQTLLATQNDAGAFLEAAKLEIDGAINSLRRSVAISMFRGGYGDVGQVDTTTTLSGTTIQLANVSDVTNFEVGQQLSAAATLSSGATRALGSSGNGLLVTAVDRNLGILTFGFAINDATNGIPNIANGDFLFTTGDRPTTGAATALKLSGLAAWLPTTAPAVGGGDSFFSIDRSVDPSRLSGQRINGTQAPLEEVFVDALAQVAREGGAPDTLFCSYAKYAQLEKALGSKVQIIQIDATPQVGFRGISIAGPTGDVKIVPDQNCPDNRAYLLQLDTWKLYSLGPVVRPFDSDGLTMLRQATSDGVEVRYISYAQLGCRAPSWNAVISL